MARRILLDTNVLLTGMFAPSADSNELLRDICDGRYTAYVLENSITEAEGAIRRAKESMGIDLQRAFDGGLRQLNIPILPRVTRSEWKGYNRIKGKGDKAIAAAAAKIDVEICTNDLDDFKKASDYGLSTTTPSELVSDGSIGLHTLMPGMLASPSIGSIYCELPEMNWRGVSFKEADKSRFYVFDSEGFGALYFLPSETSLIFELDGGLSTSAKYRSSLEDLSFVAAYDADEGISLYIQNEKFVEEKQWVPCAKAIRGFSVGNDRNGANQLNGGISRMFGLPIMVNEKEAINILERKTVHDPKERLSLEHMIKLFILP